MPTIHVRGITHNQIKNFTDAQLQDLRGSIYLCADLANKFDSRSIAVMGRLRVGTALKRVRLGYVASELLDRAHEDHWTDWSWEIDEIGRFQRERPISTRTTYFNANDLLQAVPGCAGSNPGRSGFDAQSLKP